MADLHEMFDQTHDGHVAFALAEQLLSAGDATAAAGWFETAERLYPLPAFRAKARAAAERARGATRASSAPGEQASATDAARSTTATEETVYVVACTRSKAWDDPAYRDIRFVPAGLAYTGGTMQTWRRSGPAAAGARWLILSAKYGFIEPDHPVASYDVTFSDPQTGPVDTATLVGQVRHQTRWADAVPLRDIRRVTVLGSSEYLRRTRDAFSAVGVTVVPWDDAEPAEVPPTAAVAPAAVPRLRPGLRTSDPADRAIEVGQALGQLPARVFASADRFAPEWPLLGRLGELPDGLDVVTTLALALADYQLGTGGALGYWTEAAELFDRMKIRTIDDVGDYLRALMARPVASRLAEMKISRTERVLASEVPALVAGGVGTVDPGRLWTALVRALRTERDSKTVVFAIKTVGLLHMAVTGRLLPLPENLPIPVDLRVARVTLAAGLIAPSAGLDVVAQMENVEQYAADNRAAFVQAWRRVSHEVGLAPPQMDTLLWELAVPLHVNRRTPPAAQAAMQELLLHHGAERGAAEAVARELTVRLPGGAPS